MPTAARTGWTTTGAWNRVLMHDIGLVQLFAAGRVLFCLPAGMAAGYLVGSLFGLPAVVGLLLGALPAFLSCFVIVDEKASRVAARTGALYIPFVLALFGSIALHEHRVLELALIVVLLFVQFYSTRFGTWVGDFGGGLFAAYLCGLLLPLPLTSFPALALVFAASIAATIVVRSLLFHPNAYRSLMRSRRAFLGWETRVLEASASALEHDASGADARTLKDLAKVRARAREAALIADGLLAKPDAGPTGETAEHLHRLLFDTEQAVNGLARIATELVAADAPREVRSLVAASLRTVLAGGGHEGHRAARDLLGAEEGALHSADPRWSPMLQRTALLLTDIASSSDEWTEVRRGFPRTGDGVPFQSPVVLFGGRPAGATPIVNAEVEDGGMSGPWRRIKVSPALRTAIQAGVAVAIVEPLALLLDGQRFYWGVIGVMVILAGTNSTHDRLRKVGSRGLGTILGGAIGIGLVAVLGTTHPWISMLLVVMCLAGGMYSITRSYTAWTVALVITLCQVYAFSGQLTDSLILFRLAENLLGALVAVGVSLVILPVATGVMIRRAALRHLASVQAFLEAASGLGTGTDGPAALRSASRAVDQAGYQLESVMRPLVGIATGGLSRDERTRALLEGIGGALSSIAYRGEQHLSLAPDRVATLDEILSTMVGSVRAVSHAVSASGSHHRRITASDGSPTRSAERQPAPAVISAASLIGDLDGRLDSSKDDVLLSQRLHALVRVDIALSELAELYGGVVPTRV